MMSMMRIYVYVCFFVTALLVSCMEDKGNYDYVAVNEIQIDTIKNQTIELYDTLRVVPKVTCSLGKSDELSYLWYKYVGKDGSMVDTISRERDLAYKVSDLVGSYQVFYKVTDETTGLSGKTSFMMNVVGKFGEGLIVLGEADGKTSLVFINEAGNVISLYGGATGDLLGRNPVWVGNATAPNISTLKDIVVLCDDGKGGKILSNADFTVSNDVTDDFFVKPTNFKPQAYYRAYNNIYNMGFADFIISDGKLHGRATYYESDLGRSVAFNPAVEGKYELCPYAIVCPAAYLFFDNAGDGRFVTIRQSMFSMDDVFYTLTSKLSSFDPNKLGMKCIYLTEAALYNGERSGYGIFRDNATGELQGLRFSLRHYADDGGPTEMELYAKHQIASGANGIEEATGYAMSLARPHMYYSKGSKVYFYGIDNNECYPIYDVDTVPELGNSVIDKICMEYVTGGFSNRDVYGWTSDAYNKVLYISSHKEGEPGNNGTIHVVNLNDNGTVEKRTALYRNACGRTVSMYYKR